MPDQRVSTGIDGLDAVLDGGFLPAKSYLLSGAAGTGKTTIGWHFLCAGVAAGESVLFITFGEPEDDLRQNATRTGFDVSKVTFVDGSPSSDLFTSVESYDVFSPAEVEREPLSKSIIDAVDQNKPDRIFVDSISHLRYLSRDAAQFRKQTLSFLRYLTATDALVLLASEASEGNSDDDLRFMTDGVIELGQSKRAGTLSVKKFRGSAYRKGDHSLILGARGATVLPRLVPEEHRMSFERTTLPFGVAALDELLHGGIERGTVTLLTGPSGVGKTTLGVQFMKEAASRGHRTAIYTFDESTDTLVRRAESTNTKVRQMMERGTLAVTEIEAMRYGADEFAAMVREDVERNQTHIVMIDSLSGYRLSVDRDELSERIHALCKYLQNVGVTVVLVNEMQDVNDFRISEAGISYLADNVLYLRYVERGEGDVSRMRKGIGILKKRLSDFENYMMEYRITAKGFTMEKPSSSLKGVLR